MASLPTYYGMFTKAGNQAVHDMVVVVDGLRVAHSITAANVAAQQAMARIEKKHGEVNDTVVREDIYAALDPNGEWLELYSEVGLMGR